MTAQKLNDEVIARLASLEALIVGTMGLLFTMAGNDPGQSKQTELLVALQKELEAGLTYLPAHLQNGGEGSHVRPLGSGNFEDQTASRRSADKLAISFLSIKLYQADNSAAADEVRRAALAVRKSATGRKCISAVDARCCEEKRVSSRP